MKLDRTTRHRQRKALDARLREFTVIGTTPRPRKGWVRAIRESLGMNSRQLARKLKVTVATALDLESREVRGTISLDILDKAARALGCKLVYAIVPLGDETLDSMLTKRAHEIAAKQMKSVSHSMRLEDQTTSKEALSEQTEELAKLLKERLDTSLWEP